MLLNWLTSFAKGLEDPKHPFLGPNVKGLYLFGLLQAGRSRVRIIIYNIFYIVEVILLLSQILELYMIRHDLNKALQNFSTVTINAINCTKSFSFIIFQRRWFELISNISQEEITRNKNHNQKRLIEIEKCKKYARMLTYSFWMATFVTNILLIVAPLIVYETITSNNNSSVVKSYPELISSWFPFDKHKMPGYFYACVVHAAMSIQASSVLCLYDTTAVTIMTFLKGQLIILRIKCAEIFENETNNDESLFLARIKECHRHHNFLIKQYTLFNSLLSPVMFLYVLTCSVTICFNVVQLSVLKTTPSQKLWVIEYTSIQIFQLFMFCWHANEVYVESIDLDRGVYASDWWKADVLVRKQVLLLACKLDCPLLMNAGPFSSLSILTFQNIIKGAYSFYTLFSQLHE